MVLSRPGAKDAPGVLDDATLERDRCGQKHGVQSRAVESFADVGSCRHDQQGCRIVCVRGKPLHRLGSLASLQPAGEHDGVQALLLEEVRDAVDVRRPLRENQAVALTVQGCDHVRDDLFDTRRVGDQVPVDGGHAPGRLGVGVTDIPETGRVEVEHPVDTRSVILIGSR